MITDAQRAKIRRLFFAEHWKVGTIAAELGVHHDTVHLAIESRCCLRRSAALLGGSSIDVYGRVHRRV